MFGYRIARNPTNFFFLCIDLLYQLIFADQVGDLGYATELGNYAEYSGAPNKEEVLRYARVVIDVRSFSLHSLGVMLLFYITRVNCHFHS
jgi:hypothetical protein